MLLRQYLLPALLLTLAGGSQAEVYKWKDEKGMWHFGDQAGSGAQVMKGERKKLVETGVEVLEVKPVTSEDQLYGKWQGSVMGEMIKLAVGGKYEKDANISGALTHYEGNWKLDGRKLIVQLTAQVAGGKKEPANRLLNYYIVNFTGKTLKLSWAPAGGNTDEIWVRQ